MTEMTITDLLVALTILTTLPATVALLVREDNRVNNDPVNNFQYPGLLTESQRLAETDC